MNDQIRQIVSLALAEDVGTGDVTTRLTVPEETPAKAEITAKQDLVLAGLAPARLTFEMVDPRVRFTADAADGDRLKPGDVAVRLEGPAASILTAERVALNFLMRLSGVATLTARYVAELGDHPARMIDTRKTTPGMRALEKAAVRAGGGANHRFGLYDGILIKDNHIAAAGSISAAVDRARKGGHHLLKIEVEVEDLDGLKEAIAAGADAVLLDNMSPEMMAEAASLAGGQVILEASGGITLENVGVVATTGVHFISSGALTHSAPAADLSLNFL